MTQKKSNKKLIVIGAIVLAVLIAVLGTVYFVNRQKGTEGGKTLTIEVIHKDGTEKDFTVKTDAEDLGTALVDEKIVEDNQTDYGLYILTADGETADENNQEWWCITKGGEMLNTGASQTMIADGETYELTFTVGW